MSTATFQTSLLALGVLMSGSAEASTPESWRELNKRAARACIAASDLRRSTASTPVTFDDRTGVLAILVTGISARVTAEPRVSELCLFNRRTGRATIEEAPGWRFRS